MKCKLCLQEKKLLKKSHIIPDFLYKGVYDENHFIAPVKLSTLKSEKFIPNGVYDKEILCEKCDNEIIGKLESYTSIVLYGGKGKQVNYPRTKRCINGLKQKYLFIDNIDYVKFKLFLLSILWRASISRHDFFKSVSLHVHEEKIRQMIYSHDAGEEDDYPLELFILKNSKNIPINIVSPPKKIK